MIDTLFILWVFFVFLIGISVGSFTNVLIDRLPKSKKIFFDRSRCENCKKTLSPLELIPLISFIVLQGKCYKCKHNIPIRIFFLEFLMGMLYSLFFTALSLGLISPSSFVFISLLMPIFTAIFFIDLETGFIPDILTIYIFLISLIFRFLFEKNLLLNSLISGIVAFAFFFFLYKITREKGIGAGDVKLALALGTFLAFPKVIVGVYIAFLTGALISIILVLWGKKKFRKSTIPFGPFLIFSSIISYFWGEKIIELFQVLFLR